MRQIDVGQPLTFKLQVFDGDTSLFPRAHVYDSSDAEISGSPFSLTHLALGRYKAVGPIKPAGIYDVVYIVYTDSGHTTESTAHDRVSDEIKVSSIAQSSLDSDIILVDEEIENIILVGECE